MHEHENVDVVNDAYRAFNEGNFDALQECLGDNVKWFAIGPPDLIPTAGTRYGPEQVSQYFSLLESNGELQRLKPLEIIAEGDKVVAVGELQTELRASGSTVRSPWVHIFTVQRGRITEFRSFYDTATAIAAQDNQRGRQHRRNTAANVSIPAIF